MPLKLLYTALLLITTLFVNADEKGLDTLVLRTLATSRALPQERVYLHFDNCGYYLGETMWFKAYCVGGNGTNIAAVPQSKVLYVELCAPEGYVVETKKYKLDDRGCCNGEFELKPSLLSGYYEVRAYTRYMLNRGDDAIFSRVFPVYDKVNADNYDFKNMLDRKRSFLYRGEWVTQESKEPTLTFYPEGGHMIADVETKVAYELRDKGGEPLNDTITLYAAKKPLLTTVATHNGKGHLIFAPKKDVEYHAEVKSGKKRYKFSLPAIENGGTTVAVRYEGDSVRFAVLGDKKLTGAFVIINRNQTYIYKRDVSELVWHRNKLREGVNRCLLLSADGTPLCERMFFIKHSTPQQGDIVPIKLKAEINGLKAEDEETFRPYNRLIVKIGCEDGSPLPKDGSYSVAVSNRMYDLSTSYSNNIYTQMLLSSELKGYIPDAAQYFADDSEETREKLDLLMLTHGWTAYDWSMLAQTDSFTPRHPVEKGIQVKGFFMKREKVKRLGKFGTFRIVPLKGVNVRFDISYSDSTIDNYEFLTGEGGNFTLEIPDFYGKKYASLTPTLTGRQIEDTIYKFSLDKYFSPKFKLYDYWQRNSGSSIGGREAGPNSLFRLDGINELDEVDITAKKHKGRATRTPRSEIRLDFMDEWEYAQDVSYLNTPNDNRMASKAGDASDIFEDVNLSNDEEYSLYMQYDFASESNYISEDYNLMAICTATDNWRVYGWEGPRYYGYENVLSAYEVLQSAFWRHNYNWAYWVKMIVPQEEYSSERVPIEDKEYIKGKDPVKMMNFKEIVIRSDEPTLKQFRNENWYKERGSFLNKRIYRSFYFGFMMRSSITPQDDKPIDGYPGYTPFLNNMARRGINLAKIKEFLLQKYSDTHDTIAAKGNKGTTRLEIRTDLIYNTDIAFQQKMYPEHPNYVACFIPNKEEERVTEGIIPELSIKTTRRYTRIQGYSRSKQFYSPDYTNNKPDATTKDYRRALLWEAHPTIGDDGCITVELHCGSSECVPAVDVCGVNKKCFYSTE